MRRSLERIALVGALTWLALWLATVRSVLGFPLVERLILAGPLVVAPLALALHGRDGTWKSGWYRALVWTLLPAALCAAASAVAEPGPLSVGLCVVWLVWTVGAAAYAGLGALTRRLLPLDRLAMDAGFVYLPVGAVWWLASRAEIALLGFDPVIVTLTAAHFHFAGLAASSIAGNVGLVLRGRRRLYGAAAVLVVGTPILVALGILGAPALEVVTSFLLALGVLGLSSCMLIVAWCERARRPVALLLGGAALASFATMSLAVYFALGEFTGADRPSILTMAESHGALNVLGFALPALVGLHLLRR